MRIRSFASGAVPGPYGDMLRRRLHRAHEEEPFSPLRPRAVARRVGVLAGELGLSAHLYRGGVELTGTEVDHVWLALGDVVIDLAFPLFEPEFRALLPRFVAGEIEAVELEHVAARTGVDARIIGMLPPRVRYVGHPVWTDRKAVGALGGGGGDPGAGDAEV